MAVSEVAMVEKAKNDATFGALLHLPLGKHLGSALDPDTCATLGLRRVHRSRCRAVKASSC